MSDKKDLCANCGGYKYICEECEEDIINNKKYIRRTEVTTKLSEILKHMDGDSSMLKEEPNPILHLFSGKSDIGDVRVDINPNSNATVISDVFNYIKTCTEQFNTILLDPIYCSEERQETWRDKYSKLGIKKEDLYVFPYDTRKTKKLWKFFERMYPKRIIVKSLNHYTIPNYILLQGFDVYPGAFKPNRCLSIYQAKNGRLF